MSKNRKLRNTWVRIADRIGGSVQCETLADYGRDPKTGYWRKLVILNGHHVEVRCKQKRGTFERIPGSEAGDA